MKRAYHSNCTIRRTAKVTESTFNMVTGKEKGGRTYIETKPCGTPLFGDSENQTGICRSCAKGWEVKDNKFANAKERARATGQAVK